MEQKPLVSVIIPCYNYGRYLPEALESVFDQDYPNIEILVIDDGSTDETRAICEKYPQVKYFYQPNQGLSAARNSGIKKSTGEFLIFLDADDWLLPGAVSNNLPYLLARPDCAFVSGAYEVRFTVTGKVYNSFETVNSDHYARLLEGNYVGVPATALYRRSTFDEIEFDTELKSCQDYDLYFQITRKFPVLHHSKKIAAYRIHNRNMSANISAMLSESLTVLRRQKKLLRGDAERKAYKKGKRIWKNWYSQELFRNMCAGNEPPTVRNLAFILRHSPLVMLFFFNSIINHFRVMGFDGIRFLFGKSGKENRELIRARVRWLKHELYLRSNTSDIPLFYEMYVSPEKKDFNFDLDPAIIVDCGAGIGLETVNFASRFPNATIFALEADRENFELLLKNTKAYSNVECLNYAVWNKSANLLMPKNGIDIWGVKSKEIARKNENNENSVEAVSLPDLIERFRIETIDICKINIEGNEKELFEANTEDWLTKTKTIIIDLHDRMRQGCTKSFFDALKNYDFAVFPSGSYIVCVLEKSAAEKNAAANERKIV